MNPYQRLVQDFHEKFGQPVGDYSNPKISRPELRARLIREEGEETCKAIRERNMVEVADGLCDLRYVVYGAAVEAGLVMAPTQQFCAGPPRFHDPWTLIDLDVCQRLEVLYWVASNRIESVSDIEYAASALIRLDDTCLIAADQFGIDLDPLFREVHLSNCTKTGGGTRADGKILKGPNFKAPQIARLLREQGWKG